LLRIDKRQQRQLYIEGNERGSRSNTDAAHQAQPDVKFERIERPPHVQLINVRADKNRRGLPKSSAALYWTVKSDDNVVFLGVLKTLEK
jgi:hypothetical protein